MKPRRTRFKGEDRREFDPDHSLFDYMIVRVIQSVSGRELKMPFRLRFVDAKQSIVREMEVTVENDTVIMTDPPAQFVFPLTCELTDMEGETSSFVVSQEQMKEWINSAETLENGRICITFPLDADDSFVPFKQKE
jgi:hypothetical protein